MKKPATARKSTTKGVTAADLRKIALSFPEALEKSSYGRPAFFIGKKFFTRHRAEDDSLVFIVDGIEQRDMMLELDPKTYFITEHYRNYPSVLVRMDAITMGELRTMLERRFRAIAPKSLLKTLAATAETADVPQKMKARPAPRTRKTARG